MAHTGDILTPQVYIHYDGQTLPIGSTLPIGTDFSFRFQGKNTSGVDLELGAWWMLSDPTGAVRESNNTVVGVAGPGVSYTFSGLPINLDIPGNWIIYAILYGKLSSETDWTQLDELPYGTVIAVGVAEAQYVGHISYRAILYDAKEVGFNSTIPLSESITVRVQGLSDMASAQSMAFRWYITSPSLQVVAEDTGSWLSVSPNAGIQQDIGPITLDLEGQYTIKVELLMNQSGYSLVDIYHGPLCTCIPAEQQNYTGEILDVWVNKGSQNHIAVPASVEADGQGFEFGVTWKNTCDHNYDVKYEYVIRRPDLTTALSYSSPFYGMVPDQERSDEKNVDTVDLAGEWTYTLKLILRDGTILDERSGVCLDAVGPSGAITSMWFNQGSHTRAPFGSIIPADGQNFEVGLTFTNRYHQTVICGVKVEVWDPDGIKQPTPIVDYTGVAPDEDLPVEYQFGAVDKAGEWLIKLTLLSRDEQTVMAEWPLTGNGVLFDVQPVAELTDLVILSYAKNVFAEATALSLGVSPGDTLTVSLSFMYTVPSSAKIRLNGSLWIPPGVDYTVPFEIDLSGGTDQMWEGDIEIPITDEVGLKNDTYHLLVSLPGHGLSAQVDNAIVCTGMTGGFLGGIGEIGGLIGMMITMMIVMMMMQMMGGFIGGGIGGPAKVGEKAGEWAKTKGAGARQWVQEKISPVEIHIHDYD